MFCKDEPFTLWKKQKKEVYVGQQSIINSIVPMSKYDVYS